MGALCRCGSSDVARPQPTTPALNPLNEKDLDKRVDKDTRHQGGVGQEGFSLPNSNTVGTKPAASSAASEKGLYCGTGIPIEDDEPHADGPTAKAASSRAPRTPGRLPRNDTFAPEGVCCYIGTSVPMDDDPPSYSNVPGDKASQLGQVDDGTFIPARKKQAGFFLCCADPPHDEDVANRGTPLPPEPEIDRSNGRRARSVR